MTTGYNHGFDFLPEGQSSGLRTHPVCGVLSGLDVSLAVTNTLFPLAGAGKTVTVTVSAGRARFEGVEVSLASQATPTITLPAVMTLGEVNVWDVYLNAPRKAPISTTVPAGGNAGDKAVYVKVINGGYRLIDRYENVAGTWTVRDPIKMPMGKGYGALPFNEYVTTLTTAHFSGISEADVYEAEPPWQTDLFCSPSTPLNDTAIVLVAGVIVKFVFETSKNYP
jgi:hypothetical protein